MATMHDAVIRDDARAVEALLARGGNPDALDDRGRSPLFQAIAYGSEKAGSVLIARGARFLAPGTSRTALTEAASFGRVEIVRALLQKKVDVRAADGDGNTALHLAAEPGVMATEAACVQIVRLLLAHGADARARKRAGHPKARDITPLHLAALAGSTTIAEMLLAAGAEINAMDRPDLGTPLDWAYHNQAGNRAMIALLRSRGARRG